MCKGDTIWMFYVTTKTNTQGPRRYKPPHNVYLIWTQVSKMHGDFHNTCEKERWV